MFNIIEKLITEQSDEIHGVSAIIWEGFSWNHLSLVGDEKVIWKHEREPTIKLCMGRQIDAWKDEREPTIKYCVGRQVDVQKFITIQSFRHN